MNSRLCTLTEGDIGGYTGKQIENHDKCIECTSIN